jgi:hypothetical protein
MVHQGHLIKAKVLIAVVGTVLVGSLVLLVGCAGARSEAPQEKQRHTETTTKEQTRSPEATAFEEGARCERTRTFQKWGGHFAANDLPGCPYGGLLSSIDKPDRLAGQEGDERIRGPGDGGDLRGGPGNDIPYGDDNDLLNRRLG